MDLDKILVEMKMDEVVSGDYDDSESKTVRMGTAVAKGFIESFVGSLPDKVGKDIKTRLGGSMGKRMTVEEFISELGKIMRAGNMTQMVMAKDIFGTQETSTLKKSATTDDFWNQMDTNAGRK